MEKLYGVSYPFRVSKIKGGIAMSSVEFPNTAEHLADNLNGLLVTHKGDRVMVPWFFNGADAALFEYTDESMITLMRYEIYECIKQLEDRVTVRQNDIKFEFEGTNVFVNITFTPKDFNMGPQQVRVRIT